MRFQTGFPVSSLAGIATDEMAVIVSASAAAQAAFSLAPSTVCSGHWEVRLEHTQGRATGTVDGCAY